MKKFLIFIILLMSFSYIFTMLYNEAKLYQYGKGTQTTSMKIIKPRRDKWSNFANRNFI